MAHNSPVVMYQQDNGYNETGDIVVVDGTTEVNFSLIHDGIETMTKATKDETFTNMKEAYCHRQDGTYNDTFRPPQQCIPLTIANTHQLPDTAVCTPEYKPRSTIRVEHHVSTVVPVELQLDFLRTLKKLNISIQRTDQSRTVVKRLHSSDENFFYTSEWLEVQQNRHIFAQMIYNDSLTRTVF
jgi:hypothetical protein